MGYQEDLPRHNHNLKSDDEEALAEKTSHSPLNNTTPDLGWDGPTDPARPVNWSKKKKWLNMFSIGYLTFLTPLTSSIVAPAQGLVLKEFHTTNKTLSSFVVSIYLVGFAIGPLFLAPLSEMYGRLRIYQIGTMIFVVWNVACALSPSIGALLAFRLFAGISGSSPVTLGAGSVADMFVREERGAALSIYGLGPLMGPVIGPIAGGYLSQAQGWRWVFWLLAIVVSAITFVFRTPDTDSVANLVGCRRHYRVNTPIWDLWAGPSTTTSDSNPKRNGPSAYNLWAGSEGGFQEDFYSGNFQADKDTPPHTKCRLVLAVHW